MVVKHYPQDSAAKIAVDRAAINELQTQSMLSELDTLTYPAFASLAADLLQEMRVVDLSNCERVAFLFNKGLSQEATESRLRIGSQLKEFDQLKHRGGRRSFFRWFITEGCPALKDPSARDAELDRIKHGMEVIAGSSQFVNTNSWWYAYPKGGAPQGAPQPAASAHNTPDAAVTADAHDTSIAELEIVGSRPAASARHTADWASAATDAHDTSNADLEIVGSQSLASFDDPDSSEPAELYTVDSASVGYTPTDLKHWLESVQPVLQRLDLSVATVMHGTPHYQVSAKQFLMRVGGILSRNPPIYGLVQRYLGEEVSTAAAGAALLIPVASATIPSTTRNITTQLSKLYRVSSLAQLLRSTVHSW